MELSYFNNKKWTQITRDERFFCAELYFFYKMMPLKLIELMYKSGRVECLVPEDLKNQWSIGYEVCFYRDMIFHLNKQRTEKIFIDDFSRKRTFDLCLFSETKIIVIEAKVQQSFGQKQLKEFEEDQNLLTKLRLYANLPVVHIVALASDIYFQNALKFGRKIIPELFAKNYFTWKDVFNDTNEELFLTANELYKK